VLTEIKSVLGGSDKNLGELVGWSRKKVHDHRVGRIGWSFDDLTSVAEGLGLPYDVWWRDPREVANLLAELVAA